MVSVTVTLEEAEGLVFSTSDLTLRKRLLCAIGLLDYERMRDLRDELVRNAMLEIDE